LKVLSKELKIIKKKKTKKVGQPAGPRTK